MHIGGVPLLINRPIVKGHGCDPPAISSGCLQLASTPGKARWSRFLLYKSPEDHGVILGGSSLRCPKTAIHFPFFRECEKG